MAIAKVQMPDGRIARLEVPDGTSQEQVMAYVNSMQQGKPQEAKPSSLGREEDTLQVFNPFGKNFDTGIRIGADWSNALAGAGKAFYDTGRGVGQMLGVVDQKDVDESKKRDAELMKTKAGFSGNVAGNIAQVLPAAFVPGANTYVGAGLVGSGLGLVQPVGEGESRLNNTIMGGAFGAAGHGAGKLIGKAVSSAGNKMRAIEQKVAAKAAADAAAETASARSAAGNAAQNAYKQLEHLRELKALRGLTPQEAKIAKELSAELAQKAQEKLIPAVAQKTATSQAYREAIETEAERAARMAADKLSGSEIKRQVGHRLKRYGPGVVGGMVGNMLFPGLGGMVGGAATGLVLRPMGHSIRRLLTNPAVQHKLLQPIAKSGLLADLANPRVLGLLAPSIYAAKE